MLLCACLSVWVCLSTFFFLNPLYLRITAKTSATTTSIITTTTLRAVWAMFGQCARAVHACYVSVFVWLSLSMI